MEQGSDFTLFAVKDGTVTFSEKKKTKYDGRVYKNRFVSIV
jgi:large subunit ribosomal protein L27